MDYSKSVSSKDVARLAGVSQATVSYVINDVPGVKIKPETREAVWAAAKTLNYHPNLIARSMRLKKAMSIGVVSDKNVSNFHFVKALEGIKDALLPHNYSVTLCFEKWQDIETAEHIRYFSSNRIDGVIFIFSDLSDEHCAFLIEQNIPFVVIHSQPSREMVNLVKTDLDRAMFEAVTGLVSRKISRIAFVGTENHHERFNRRYRSFRTAMERCGAAAGAELFFKIPGGEDGLDQFLEDYYRQNKALPDGMICETTGIGFRLLRFAARKGIQIPGELSVVAIGASRFSELSFPRLSTIETPLYEMGVTGFTMLYDLMQGNPTRNVVVLEWSFIKRDSG